MRTHTQEKTQIIWGIDGSGKEVKEAPLKTAQQRQNTLARAGAAREGAGAARACEEEPHCCCKTKRAPLPPPLPLKEWRSGVLRLPPGGN